MTVTGAISPQKMPMQLPDMNKEKKYCRMQHQSVINENEQKTDFFHIQYCVHCVISIKESISKLSSCN